MAHPHMHALSSVRKWGGKVEDYLPVHDWLESWTYCDTSHTPLFEA
jgi:hypothetical protein